MFIEFSHAFSLELGHKREPSIDVDDLEEHELEAEIVREPAGFRVNEVGDRGNR